MSDAAADIPLSLPTVRPPILRPTAPTRLERWWRLATAPAVAAGHRLRAVPCMWVALRAGRLEATVRNLDDATLRTRAWEAGAQLRRRPSFAMLAEIAALVREAIRRETGLRLNDRQIQGGATIWRGIIAEMDTGEGKTLAAILPAAAHALAGRRVHVITANDYLAGRDHEITAPVYARLGIATAAVTRDVPPDRRHWAWSHPVVYVSNSELAFDHLRDRTEQGGTSRRIAALTGGGEAAGPRVPLLDVAIVDEADSVLVDEARTPLILSGEAGTVYDAATCVRAIELAGRLHPRSDYRLDQARRRVTLTPRGLDKLDMMIGDADGIWASPIFREEFVGQALAALNFYARDRDYLVSDGKVQIVDEYTGRVFADRAWSMGLHQLIETKEGLEPSPERVPIGRLTYQSFFCRYARVGGMTGTIAEAALEMWQVYGLSTARIPTARKCRRRVLRDRVFATDQARLGALVERIRSLSTAEAAVLIGARTVASSTTIAERLRAEGFAVALLNAAADADEAAVVAEAGRAGRITIATNMAGRGTDIRPDAAALARGGLHVILTERHDALRIDRQLQGRAARQGDPGQCEAYLSLEDRLLAPSRLGPALRVALWSAPRLPGLRGWVLHRAQRKLERAHGRARWQLSLSEHGLDRTLAFSGARE